MRCTLLINGLALEELPIDEAVACADMLVATGRAVPADQWVESAAPAADAIPGGLI